MPPAPDSSERDTQLSQSLTHQVCTCSQHASHLHSSLSRLLHSAYSRQHLVPLKKVSSQQASTNPQFFLFIFFFSRKGDRCFTPDQHKTCLTCKPEFCLLQKYMLHFTFYTMQRTNQNTLYTKGSKHINCFSCTLPESALTTNTTILNCNRE